MAKRRSLQRGRDPGFIQPVAALVHRAEQGAGEVGLIPARGDAHVGGAEAGGERMHGVVQPPAVAVESHASQHALDQLPLGGHRELAAQA